MILPWSIYDAISVYCQGRMSSSLNSVEKKNEMCPIFVIFDDKIESSDYAKKAAQFLGLLRAACQTFMFCGISTCNAIIPQKNREKGGFRISWPPYISGRFFVTDALNSLD